MVNISSDKLLYVGVITSPHGIKGNVKIKTFTTTPKDIASFQEIFDQSGIRHAISLVSIKQDHVIARVDNITDRTQAEKLAGLKFYINRSTLPPTDVDEYYHADLIGLQARNSKGHLVGIVENVDNFGASDLLEIRRKDSNKLFYHPFSKDFILDVNLDEKFIVLEDLEEIADESHDDIQNEPCFIVTIDGPSAAGKGTIAKKLAVELGFDYLDTGLMYRLVAYHTKAKGLTSNDIQGLVHLAKNINYSDLEPEIETQCRAEEIGNIASNISQIPELRNVLANIQRSFPLNKIGAVIDGRDIGSVIFPYADCKLYITASPEIRAQRRFVQAQQTNNSPINLNFIKEDLRKRDERDRMRNVSPLLIPEDALVIDTSATSIDESCSVAKQKVLSLMNKQ